MSISLTRNNQIFENKIKTVNVRELSAVTGFKIGTIYNWIYREPEFPYLKWGKAVRFYLDEVHEWLDKRR